MLGLKAPKGAHASNASLQNGLYITAEYEGDFSSMSTQGCRFRRLVGATEKQIAFPNAFDALKSEKWPTTNDDRRRAVQNYGCRIAIQTCARKAFRARCWHAVRTLHRAHDWPMTARHHRVLGGVGHVKSVRHCRRHR